MNECNLTFSWASRTDRFFIGRIKMPGAYPGFYSGGATEAERHRREHRGAERGGDWGAGVPIPIRL